jgi:NAD(P)-dependent dehydrogenase (short-subunit alcohol dehydrogenase family)
MTLPAAIVTGASRGLGAGIARKLAETGRPVVLAARDPRALEAVASTVRERGGEALAVTTDVTDADSVGRLVATTLERFGAIDLVVNNAGARPLIGTLDAMTWDAWRRNIDVDVHGAFNVIRAAAPHLRRQPAATLVNVAAGAVAAASPGHVSYSPAQVALVSLSRCVGSWLAPSGVAVHCLCPEITPAGGIGVTAAAAFGAEQQLSGPEWFERTFAEPRLSADDVGDAVVELDGCRNGAEWWLTAAGLARWDVLQGPPRLAAAR